MGGDRRCRKKKNKAAKDFARQSGQKPISAALNGFNHNSNDNTKRIRDPDRVVDKITGKTMLIDAVMANDAERVSLLLASGADPDLQTLDGKTALHHAARRGYADIAGLLLAAGAAPMRATKCRKRRCSMP